MFTVFYFMLVLNFVTLGENWGMWEYILIITISVATGIAIAVALQARPRFAIVTLDPLKFVMPNPDPNKVVKIVTEKVWFINKGMPDVHNIEMTCAKRPAGFYFNPSISYEESHLSNGSWRLSMPTLKTGETIELYMMNASAGKKFRFKGGRRIAQQTIMFPIASTRVIKATVIFAGFGILSLLYIASKTIIPFIAQYL